MAMPVVQKRHEANRRLRRLISLVAPVERDRATELLAALRHRSSAWRCKSIQSANRRLGLNQGAPRIYLQVERDNVAARENSIRAPASPRSRRIVAPGSAAFARGIQQGGQRLALLVVQRWPLVHLSGDVRHESLVSQHVT